VNEGEVARPGAPPGALSDRVRIVGGDRVSTATCAVLVAVTVAAWVHVLSGMPGHGAMEDMPATLIGGTVYVAGWTVMMAAMMLPSALPMIALYGAIQAKAAGAATRGVHVGLFALLYLAVWALTGVPAYLASLLVDAVGTDILPHAVALVLFVAGAYQLSSLKQVCLRACRSPLGFLLARWRPGLTGSLALGWAHALYCVGCCWALMVVLVVAGAMGLAWVLLIAALVAVEKLLPHGEWSARLAGVVLVLLAVAVALRPDLLTLLRQDHPM
jgi:predicted metal-binding membrane protein